MFNLSNNSERVRERELSLNNRIQYYNTVLCATGYAKIKYQSMEGIRLRRLRVREGRKASPSLQCLYYEVDGARRLLKRQVDTGGPR